MSYGVGHRRGSDLSWLWLWLAATSSIRPLAWKLPHAAPAALKKTKKKKKKKGSGVRENKKFHFSISNQGYYFIGVFHVAEKLQKRTCALCPEDLDYSVLYFSQSEDLAAHENCLVSYLKTHASFSGHDFGETAVSDGLTRDVHCS